MKELNEYYNRIKNFTLFIKDKIEGVIKSIKKDIKNEIKELNDFNCESDNVEFTSAWCTKDYFMVEEIELTYENHTSRFKITFQEYNYEDNYLKVLLSFTNIDINSVIEEKIKDILSKYLGKKDIENITIYYI